MSAALLVSGCGGESEESIADLAADVTTPPAEDLAMVDEDSETDSAKDTVDDKTVDDDTSAEESASNDSADKDSTKKDSSTGGSRIGQGRGVGVSSTSGSGSSTGGSTGSGSSTGGSTGSSSSTGGSTGSGSSSGGSSTSSTTSSSTTTPSTTSSTTAPSTTAPSTTSSTTAPSTTSSTSTTIAATVPITTTAIDCISGEFSFQFSDPNNAGQITSIQVFRDGVLDESLVENANGMYRTQIKDSSEVVTAVVGYSASGASYSHTHELADCSQIMGGQYKICNGEGIHTAYPATWFSQQDVEGPGFCGYFRSVAPDGYSGDEITRKGFAGQTLSQVVAAYNSDPNVVVVNSMAKANIGTLLARPGHILDIAHPNDPAVVISRIYLFESSGNTQEIRADQVHSGTDPFPVLAAMMDTLSLFEQ